MIYAPKTIEELAAVGHVHDAIIAYGKHSLTSCPMHTRAMCSHRQVLQALIAKGWVHP